MADRISTISAASVARTLPTTPKTFRSFDVNIKKVAVTLEGSDKGAQLIEFDQKRPLNDIIDELCKAWTLATSSSYAIRFNDQGMKTYITEKNRKEIKDGNVLLLASSAIKNAEDLKAKISGSKMEEKNSGLRQLSLEAADVTFAEEFIHLEGLQLIIDGVTSGNCKGDALAYMLKSFVCLMEHGLKSWDILNMEFIRRVADCINCSPSKVDISCLQPSLDILESVVLHCADSQTVVEQVVTPVIVIPHLESSSPEVQKSAIALINALFSRAGSDRVKRKKIAESLQSKSMRNIIMTSVIKGERVGTGMAHELYVLQSLLLNLNEDRMKTTADLHDQLILREIEELRRIAFDVDGDPNINTVKKSSNSLKDYERLGFENDKSPIEDFVSAPPGLLALDVMLYFARNHGQNYVKVVLENSTRADEHDCPFVQASKMLTKILCEVLNIGEPPTDDGQIFYSMFFTHDKPFEEFFCICIQLLNKTWREMKATAQDFRKVLDVVREQITRVLDSQPSSFETFRSKINSLTYSEINKLWESDRVKKEGQGAQLKPIIELREKITPEIMELVKQQRLNFLMTGTRFGKYRPNSKITDKFWYWRLSPNHKALLYTDCGESSSPSLEEMTNKLSISNIDSLQVGKDCPHIAAKDKGKAKNLHSNLAFSFRVGEDSDPICFVASSENEYNMWTDGLNCLLGNEMMSVQVAKDRDTLLSMEIKMRMLETEGLSIPAEAPMIPEPPVNYNFAYQL